LECALLCSGTERNSTEGGYREIFQPRLTEALGNFSIYEKFEHLIITLLTAIIAAIVGAATWQLILHTFALVRSHLLDPRDAQVFQTVFGMVLTVLIAMEFKHSLLIVLHQQRDIVQIRAVVLIALLAMVRKFIILDIYQTQPSVVFALAAASLSLGIVFWLVRNEDAPEPASEMPNKEADAEADITRHLPTVGSHEQWHSTEKNRQTA
jgi:uncharacterized membrane protein (DUF373 family)